MKILLIRPDTPKESINLQSFMICEPLELEYVAASLIQNGHEVDLVDMLLENEYLSHTSGRDKIYELLLQKIFEIDCKGKRRCAFLRRALQAGSFFREKAQRFRRGRVP